MMKQGTASGMEALDFFSDSKRNVANLMAREGISVQVIPGIETAAFNCVDRVLVVPAWKLPVDCLDTLLCHEIGHALFSDSSVFEKIAKEDRGFFSYVNIIEDARIERKMKSAFPGIARTMYNGYQEFHTNGPILKGTTDSLINPKTDQPKLIAELKLIDKINVYYKIGAFCKVPFTPAEQVWIAKIDKCGSMDQAIEIAKALYALAKEQKQDKQDQEPQQGQKPQPSKGPKQESDQQPSDSDQQDGEQGDAGEGDESKDSKDQGDEAKGDDSKGDPADSADESEAGDQDTKSGAGASGESAETVQDMEDILKGLAKSASDARGQITHLLLAPVPADVLKARTMTATEWATASMKRMVAEGCNPHLNHDLDLLSASWNNQFMTTAQHMALEFERRKNAKALQNAKVAKTGKLNLSKLHAYKFTDDLFIRSCTMPNGKSHGVVMLIDGSGSMQDGFANVIDQVLLFAHFAQKVSIPFEAYMFTNSSEHVYYDGGEIKKHEQGLHQINLSDDGTLVGLVNTASGAANFKQQVRVLLAVKEVYTYYGSSDPNLSVNARDTFKQISYIHLGGTPLFTGMLLAERMIERMKRVARLDKMTFVLITDGEDGSGLHYRKNEVGWNGTIGIQTRSITDGPFVVRDTVTKQNFAQAEERASYYGNTKELALPSNAVITMLTDVIKARHDCRVVSIYIQSASIGRRLRRYRANTESVDGVVSMTRAGVKANEVVGVDAVRAALTADGQYILPAGIGIGDLAIVLKGSALRLTENDFEKLNTTDMTQKKISKAFTAACVKAVSNRKFVGSVTPYLT